MSPKRQASTIADRNGKPNERAEALVDAIKAVLNDAIKAGGSSLRDHRQADGSLGYFQHHFQVYDREGEPCPVLQGHGEADRADRALDVLLPEVPEVSGCRPGRALARPGARTPQLAIESPALRRTGSRVSPSAAPGTTDGEA